MAGSQVSLAGKGHPPGANLALYSHVGLPMSEREGGKVNWRISHWTHRCTLRTNGITQGLSIAVLFAKYAVCTHVQQSAKSGNFLGSPLSGRPRPFWAPRRRRRWSSAGGAGRRGPRPARTRGGGRRTGRSCAKTRKRAEGSGFGNYFLPAAQSTGQRQGKCSSSCCWGDHFSYHHLYWCTLKRGVKRTKLLQEKGLKMTKLLPERGAKRTKLLQKWTYR